MQAAALAAERLKDFPSEQENNGNLNNEGLNSSKQNGNSSPALLKLFAIRSNSKSQLLSSNEVMHSENSAIHETESVEKKAYQIPREERKEDSPALRMRVKWAQRIESTPPFNTSKSEQSNNQHETIAILERSTSAPAKEIKTDELLFLDQEIPNYDSESSNRVLLLDENEEPIEDLQGAQRFTFPLESMQESVVTQNSTEEHLTSGISTSASTPILYSKQFKEIKFSYCSETAVNDYFSKSTENFGLTEHSGGAPGGTFPPKTRFQVTNSDRDREWQKMRIEFLRKAENIKTGPTWYRPRLGTRVTLKDIQPKKTVPKPNQLDSLA